MTPAKDPLAKPDNLLSRREFIGNTVKLAALGAIIPGAASQLLPFVAPDALGGGGEQPIVRRDPRTNQKIPITVRDLAGEPPVVVTAEYAFLPAVIYKVRTAVLRASTQARGYNTAQHAIQHPTEPDHAILVYDGKCKHLGCTVGWLGQLGGSKDVADYDGDGINDGRILCPCHQGQYDIYNLALNQPATPPPAPLNVIRARVGSATTDGNSASDAIIGVTKIIQNGFRDADLEGDGSGFSIGSQAPEEGDA
jgi:Rieske Fe-S protein